MPTSEFVTWGAGVGANTMTAADYAADATRQAGAQAGVASSIRYNTSLRQTTTIAAAIAKFIADNQTLNVVDNGDVATIEAQFIAALAHIAGLLDLTPHFFTGTDVGAADALQVNDCYPPITAYNSRCIYFVNVGYDNQTTNPQMQVGGLGFKPLRRADQTACRANDIQSGEWIMLADTGSYFEIIGLVTDFIASANGATFRTTTVWTVPPGIHAVKKVRVWAPGGGGGGASGATDGGFAGGAGGYSEQQDVPVSPGDSISVLIGAAGVGGIGAQNGTNGGTTSFVAATPIYATGGTGGDQSGGTNQGIGGNGFNGSLTIPGDFGGFPVVFGSQASGGLGGGAPFSIGGGKIQITTVNGLDGHNGGFPGCGGNGGCSGSAATSRNGGNGGPGLCAIEW